ncbi:L-threonylcarbamoyladenylate synthase [Marinicella meishanensis]|uniref:L-threonylcarbamoyladenylate synthase n=1 Tax=Marinicella meishanensis TaxID=2873263 RepID=UPI001CBDF299|nr:L-threonylcarbamoyladenylate synthase [Marinicella sp. NBU2979]
MAELGTSIKQAADSVRQGGVLVYPTEGVFGIGCDYRDEAAVQRILQLKRRPVNMGLILIASHLQQLLPLIQPADPFDLARALKTWPGHHTWVFPATALTPRWITGDHDTVAVRLTDHPAVKTLCDELGHALVSTSANLSGQPTPNSCAEIAAIWGDQVDHYLDLPLGQQAGPSAMRLASSGQVLR